MTTLSKKSWVTNEIKKKKQLKSELKKKARTLTSKSGKGHAKELNKFLKIKSLKVKKHLKTTKLKNISKETWSVINMEVGSKNKTFENLAIKNPGELNTNPDEIKWTFPTSLLMGLQNKILLKQFV